MKFLIPVFLIFIFHSCQEENAQTIVDDAIEKHGGELFESASIEFDFRERHYSSTRDGGKFQYTREITDSVGKIRDVLTNDGFTRYVNDSIVQLTEERIKAFTNSVNSVIYFAVLPFGLNDPAVKKTLLQETTINDQPYNVILVSFNQEGGGKDHEDKFLYWIHQKNGTMDYLAYSYKTDEGGLRFRQAINSRAVNGITFQDYVNYKPKDENIALEKLEKLFKEQQLEKLSEITLENIRVKPL